MFYSCSNNKVLHLLILRVTLLCAIFSFFSVAQLFGQREGNIWYFGEEAGMDFNMGAPVPLVNGAMTTFEGCAAISSPSGSLLFYTDGITIYNAQHVPMANGTGLMGDPSTSQSGVIVKLPGSSNIYYVFSVDNDAGPDGIRYSIVNTSLNGGLGAVTVKNIFMAAPVTEKITAVSHRNGYDVWIMTHDFNTNNYISWLLTNSGLQPPVYSPIGMVHGPLISHSRGCMKVSPDGKWLASAVTFQSKVELFSFDDSLGTISNLIEIPNIQGAFGIEFSPRSKIMYVSTADISPGDLFQFDLSLPSALDIVNSRTLVGQTTSLSMGSLQLGPDRKIYCARFSSPFLGVIPEPDSLGLACGFNDNGFFLSGKRSYLGLPSFVQSYFLPPKANFNYTNPCFGDSTQFFGSSSYEPVDFLWNFGDPIGGPNNVSTQQYPSHLYPAPGNYSVTLIVSKDSLRDTIIHVVTVYAYPDIDLGPRDTILCDVPLLVLNPGPASYYLWNTGETTPTITVTADGWYSVEAGNGPCRITDSIYVDFRPRPYVNLGVDRKICDGEFITFDAGNTGANYIWSTGATTQTIQAGVGGTYWVEVNLGDCIESDTVRAAVIEMPDVNLGADRSYCLEQVSLSANTRFPVLWSTGENLPAITITQSGDYWAEAVNDICVDRDSVSIDLFAPVRVHLGKGLTVCSQSGDSTLLIADFPGEQYIWTTGDTNSMIWVNTPGFYGVTVISEDGCIGGDETEILDGCQPIIFVPNAFTPNGDGNNDVFLPAASLVSGYDLAIYDRWGKLIFQTANVLDGWDGNYGGVAAPEGGYVWVIHYRAGEGEMQELKGTVLLIR